jgi:hypothetical protein
LSDLTLTIKPKDVSGREIKGVAEKVDKKEMLTELKRSRVSPHACHEIAVLMVSPPGSPVKKIAPYM